MVYPQLTAIMATWLACWCGANGGPLSISPAGTLELGAISDQQIVQKPFTITNTSDKQVSIELAYCHFCPPPSISKDRLAPGESGTLLLEIHPRNRRGEVRASAGLMVGGIEVASANMNAIVHPRVWVEPWHLTIRSRKSAPATGQALVTLRHRIDDAKPAAPRARVIKAECDSPLFGVALGEPEVADDLGVACHQQLLTLTLSPDAPLGSTSAHVVLSTSDPLVPSVSLSVECVVQGEAATEPDSVFVGVRVGEAFAAEFDVVAPDPGVLEVLEIGVEKRDECSGVILDARKIDGSRTRVMVNAMAPGRPRQSASIVLNITYRIETGALQVLTVPVSMMVKPGPGGP